MLVCAICGGRFDEHAGPVVSSSDCPLCGGVLLSVEDPPLDDAEPVHADVARVLREHLLGVGA